MIVIKCSNDVSQPYFLNNELFSNINAGQLFQILLRYNIGVSIPPVRYNRDRAGAISLFYFLLPLYICKLHFEFNEARNYLDEPRLARFYGSEGC